MMGLLRPLCLGALILLAFGGLAIPSQASCAPPSVIGGNNPEADFEETLVSGGRGTITGVGFAGDCDDDGGVGCGGEDDVDIDAYDSVELTLRGPLGRKKFKGELRSLDLGPIDVDSNGTFTHAFDVPKLPAGFYDVISSTDGTVGTVRVVKVLE